MLALIKNAFLTAMMVIGATVATVSCAGVAVMLLESGESIPSDPSLVLSGSFLMAVIAAAAGIFFCVVTLFIAAVTMPPVIGLARFFNLPRPAVDIIGGGAAGLLCAMIGVDLFDSDKFAALVSGERAQIFAVFGLIAGCLLGYVRHAVLVRTPSPRLSPQFVG